MVVDRVDMDLGRFESWKNMDMPSFFFAFDDAAWVPTPVPANTTDDEGVLGVLAPGAEGARVQSWGKVRIGPKFLISAKISKTKSNRGPIDIGLCDWCCC